jgi:hypothetical protein
VEAFLGVEIIRGIWWKGAKALQNRRHLVDTALLDATVVQHAACHVAHGFCDARGNGDTHTPPQLLACECKLDEQLWAGRFCHIQPCVLLKQADEGLAIVAVRRPLAAHDRQQVRDARHR